jgi:putative redox protein
MPQTIKTIYLGDLRTEATHLQSGNKIITDAPTDNHGKGEFFSPTDLLAASVGSCILTIMGIKARVNGFIIDGATVNTWKIMSENLRRVAEVKMEFDFSMCNLNDKDKEILEKLVKVSPVPLSLHDQTKQTTSLKF